MVRYGSRHIHVAAEDAELDTTLISQFRPVTDAELFGKGFQCCLGECLVCIIALPPDNAQRRFMSCCMTEICKGCFLASARVDQEARRDILCVFCRAPAQSEGPEGDKQSLAWLRKRVDAGDAHAHYILGQWHDYGVKGLTKNPERAINVWKKAAKLGSVEAHSDLGYAYETGDGVERDVAKSVHHFKIAAIGGDFLARHNLGLIESVERNMERALKHFIISTKMGYELSLKSIQVMYADGNATKDDYAQALLGYQDAMEEMKSIQRDEAKEFYRNKLQWTR